MLKIVKIAVMLILNITDKKDTWNTFLKTMNQRPSVEKSHEHS